MRPCNRAIILFFCFIFFTQVTMLHAQNQKDKKPDKTPINKPEYFKDSKTINFRLQEIKIESANETKIVFLP